jgi:hypothetical protein
MAAYSSEEINCSPFSIRVKTMALAHIPFKKAPPCLPLG